MGGMGDQPPHLNDALQRKRFMPCGLIFRALGRKGLSPAAARHQASPVKLETITRTDTINSNARPAVGSTGHMSSGGLGASMPQLSHIRAYATSKTARPGSAQVAKLVLGERCFHRGQFCSP